MDDNHPQYDLLLSRLERDKALDAVEEESLTDFTDRVVASMGPAEVTGEDITRAVQGMGRDAHHPNAWGAVINALIRRGRLEKTGEYRQMTKVSAHAHSTPVYRIVL